MNDSPVRRWRWQFGLRTLLIVMTLAAIATSYFGVAAYRRMLRKEALKAISEAGGLWVPNQSQGVDRVYFGEPEFGDAELRQIVPHLGNLPELRELDLVKVAITDQATESLAGLQHLQQLKQLYVFETPLTESGIERLRELLPAVEIKNEMPDPIATGLAGTNIYLHALIALDGSPSGDFLATGSGDGIVRVWDAKSHENVAEWEAHDNWSFAVTYSPVGGLLATGGGDNAVRLWDTSTAELRGELTGHTNDVHAIAFSSDGATLVSAGDDRVVRVWNVTTRTLTQSLIGHDGPIPGLAISPTGELLASASRDDTVRLWDPNSGALLAILAGHEDDVMCVTFSRDGRLLASAGYDSTIRLWDATTFELVRTLDGHDGRVYSVAFDRTGRTLASSAADGVRLWQVSTGTCELTVEQPNVSRVVFDPAGRGLVTTNADGELSWLDATGVTTVKIRTMYGQRGLDMPLDLAHR